MSFLHGVRAALGADLRYALRGLRARPWFALTALSTLALGIGAATAIFAVVNATLLVSLPYREPARLMTLSLRMPVQASAQYIDMSWSYPKFLFLREHQRAFSALSLFSPETIFLRGEQGAERISGEAVSMTYFDLLGVNPILGRSFTDDEDRAGGSTAVVLIGERFWRTRLSARTDVLGQTLTIGATPHVIIGVLPESFSGLSGDAQLWLPAVDTRSAASLGD